jgi:hypothetical protein
MRASAVLILAACRVVVCGEYATPYGTYAIVVTHIKIPWAGVTARCAQVGLKSAVSIAKHGYNNAKGTYQTISAATAAAALTNL